MYIDVALGIEMKKEKEMSLKKLAEDIAVCGQLLPADLPAIAAEGYKTLINNRPDNEGADQPARADLEAKARELGMTIHYLPMATGTPPSVELLQAFNAIFESAEKPVLAFCRTGNRSGQIYSGAMALKGH